MKDYKSNIGELHSPTCREPASILAAKNKSIINSLFKELKLINKSIKQTKNDSKEKIIVDHLIDIKKNTQYNFNIL